MIMLYDTDEFPEGKHKGKPLHQVADEDPEYLKSFNQAVGKSDWRKRFSISDEMIKSVWRRKSLMSAI